VNYSVSLKSNHIFRRLYAKGKRASSPRLVLYCRKNGSGGNRLGITVSVKLGHAVCRNRIKRRLREVYRTNETRFAPGWDIILMARAPAVKAPYSVLETDVLRLAEQLGITR